MLPLALSSFAAGEAWDSSNNPSQWGQATTKLSSLPLTASTATVPWSDTYWPSYLGGIALRWADDADGNPGFNYKLYSLADLKASAVDISILSPAEKFDILNGRYDYPLVNSEWSRTSPDDPTWEGLCHGWAPASELYPQPQPTQVTNKDGLVIPFGSSDVKALLIYFLGQYAVGGQTLFLGQRCNYDIKASPNYANRSECRDLNAGAFVVTMATQVGQKGTAFVADIDRSIQVWNQPVFGYAMNLGPTRGPSSGSAAGTAQEQRITFTMHYVKETEPSNAAHDPYVLPESYQLWVELDSNGNILGGSWDSWDRPDFIWLDSSAPAFSGYFSSLQGLVQNSTVAAAAKAAPKPWLGAGVLRHTTRTGSFSAQGPARVAIVPRAAGRGVAVRITASHGTHGDQIRVYEAYPDGSVGALVSVLRAGKKGTVNVKTPAALVVAVRDPRVRGDDAAAFGFDAMYAATA